MEGGIEGRTKGGRMSKNGWEEERKEDGKREIEIL